MKRYHFYNQKILNYFYVSDDFKLKSIKDAQWRAPSALVQPLPHSQPAVHALCVLLEVQDAQMSAPAPSSPQQGLETFLNQQ